MRCPVDSTEMNKAQQEGIEIDFCPQCRGVWLDRGELEKIVDRAMAEFDGPDGPGEYRGGADGPPGGYDRGGYRGQGPDDRGYRDGSSSGQRNWSGPGGPEGGPPPWSDRGPGPGDDMDRGGPMDDRYDGPPQGERRRSIFDIFKF